MRTSTHRLFALVARWPWLHGLLQELFGIDERPIPYTVVEVDFFDCANCGQLSVDALEECPSLNLTSDARHSKRHAHWPPLAQCSQCMTQVFGRPSAGEWRSALRGTPYEEAEL